MVQTERLLLKVPWGVSAPCRPIVVTEASHFDAKHSNSNSQIKPLVMMRNITVKVFAGLAQLVEQPPCKR